MSIRFQYADGTVMIAPRGSTLAQVRGFARRTNKQRNGKANRVVKVYEHKNKARRRTRNTNPFGMGNIKIPKFNFRY
jgi:hypothetical protein